MTITFSKLTCFCQLIMETLSQNTSILIAPLHYVADENDGSEYTRAYHYLKFLSSKNQLSGDVLVGFFHKDSIGNLRVHSMFNKKPKYISNLMRFKFILWVFFMAVILTRKHTYDLVWHNGPFAIGETFNLFTLLNRKKTPVVMGPILSPHSFLGSDESRSMGNKSNKSENISISIIKFLDNLTYGASKIFTTLSDKTLNKATLLLTADDNGYRMLRERTTTPIIKIPLGTNISGFIQGKKSHESEVIQLLSVGYLVERKQSEVIVKAVDHLVNSLKVKNVRLTFVGDGPQRQRVERTITKKNLCQYITITGFIKRSEVHKFYADADIFVTASISECMAAMYFEAMASSLPLMTVKNNTTKELAIAGMQGILVDTGDSVGIAKGIEYLINNPGVSVKMGIMNRELVEKEFNFDKTMNKLYSILLSQIKKL